MLDGDSFNVSAVVAERLIVEGAHLIFDGLPQPVRRLHAYHFVRRHIECWHTGGFVHGESKDDVAWIAVLFGVMAAAPVRAGDVEIAVVVGGPLGIWIAFRILVDEPDYLSWIDNCPFDRKELRIFLLVVNDETGGERRRFRGAGGAA